MSDIFFYIVIAVSAINLVRMAVYLISSDVFTIKAITDKTYHRNNLPTISVIVPAHNEENVIKRTLNSLYNTDYPYKNLEVIIANDGSTDSTRTIVHRFQRTHKDRFKFRLVNQPNRGKAAALNYAIKKYGKGSLIMCLDSDSHVEKDSIRKAVNHFKDRKVIALSSNVNIIEDGSLMSLIQRFEYIVCYQMKKAQAYWKSEYIIGGIGSVFRKSVLSKVSYYDTNTMTEDIDLTLKILVRKSKNQKIAYAADSIVHTEAAHTLPSLVNQRFRWKFGRSQTYLKNRDYFFSRNKRFDKRLTWFTLPFSIFQDALFLIEPLILGWFIYLAVAYGDTITLLIALVVMTIYLNLNIWSSTHLSFKTRLRLAAWSPIMYICMFALTYAEYFALIKSLILLPKLSKSIEKQHLKWVSPTRRAIQ